MKIDKVYTIIRLFLASICSHVRNMVLFSFNDISKKGLFFFYIMYFLLYNPNLKSFFFAVEPRNTFFSFFCCFYVFFWFVCLVRIG